MSVGVLYPREVYPFAPPKLMPRLKWIKNGQLYFNVANNRILVTAPGWQAHAIGTIEMFFHVTDLTVTRTLWGYWRNWPEYVFLHILATGELRLRFVVLGVATEHILAPVGSILPSNYYAVAVVQDGTDLHGYVNGMLTATLLGVTSWFNTPALLAATDVEIGLLAGLNADYIGDMALVRYYSRPLSQPELQRNIVDLLDPDRTNLEMSLEMEEGQGATVFDKSGNGQDGAITGAVWDRLRKWEVRSQTIR